MRGGAAGSLGTAARATRADAAEFGSMDRYVEPD